MKTWREVYDNVPAAPFNASRKDERALINAFEDFVGGPERGFRLMHIHERVRQNTKMYEAGYFYGGEKKLTEEQRFIEAAKRDGFTEEQAKAFLSLP